MEYATTGALISNHEPFLKINKGYILLVSAISALGGMLFGFDTAIISGAIPSIKVYFQLNELMLGWAVSSILIGCGFGALIAGKLSDRVGRKPVLFVCAFLFAVTGIGAALAHSLLVFIACRVAGGVAVGSAAMVVPMYIAETTPASLRGRMVALYQLAIVGGILLAYMVNYALTDSGSHGWRLMFASQGLPAALFFFSLFLVPESPRWLAGRNQCNKAHEILLKTGGRSYADVELAAILQNFGKESNSSIKDLISPVYRKVLRMGMVIAIFQQITGINAILYYAPEIFKKTGVSSANAAIQTMSVGFIMFISTLIAIWLVDKTGRKKLLLNGCALMALSLIAVGICFHLKFFDHYFMLVFLLLYIAGFSASLGAVTWVLLSEIFPNQIRGLALSLVTLVLWLADFAASFSFPVLNQGLGTAATLFIFAVFCIIYLTYIKFKVPETKGKTLEELETLLSNL